MAEFVYKLVPFSGIRDFIIRRHMENCSSCQGRLVDRAQAQSLFVKSEEVGGGAELWVKIRADVEAERSASRSGRDPGFLRWEWALGAAGVLFLAAVSFWLHDGVMKTGPGQSAARTPERLEIEYINVGGAPAEPYVYQPGDSDMIFVWAEKFDQGGNP